MQRGAKNGFDDPPIGAGQLEKVFGESCPVSAALAPQLRVWRKSHIFCYSYLVTEPSFEWDPAKNRENTRKHRVSFFEAQAAFLDTKRVIAADLKHSEKEKRYYCFGSNEDGTGILTVRFTYRSGRIRIIGAGYWREGKKVYEQANSI